MQKILVIGATGQIGSELVPRLREIYGNENVIAVGHKTTPPSHLLTGPFLFADATNKQALNDIIQEHQIDVIYHLAALLSATGEKNPDLAWQVNLNGLKTVLDCAVENKVKQVFWPSSIAVFGPETPSVNTPNETIMRPKTMYGLTKVAGELLCEYYHQTHNLDVRSIRYPGIISHQTMPGGGTTDWAVAIFYDAIKNGCYTSFVSSDTVLPMMYMPDCLKATINLMQADASQLKHRCYNLAAMSFSPAELATEIKKHIPAFECDCLPDSRQIIANTWPKSIDDSAARSEWGWQPDYNISKMTIDMLEQIRAKLLITTTNE
ncbi:NAD-dependent epimerase/dehydratase family protein [Patescibacteria group bacterium]|nr:NAD-dependent epimerase/dehydratase family protein [Patescibacteria group bacterium]